VLPILYQVLGNGSKPAFSQRSLIERFSALSAASYIAKIICIV
jgi:hypothetical protein